MLDCGVRVVPTFWDDNHEQGRRFAVRLHAFASEILELILNPALSILVSDNRRGSDLDAWQVHRQQEEIK